ncbi:CHAT domain-containing protein [Streptomyces sp. NBC_00184]|uniref:CHAT domain-containing protein n=1 Tax=Streptomyces sp. NBC_00184 TaxID=2975673 RepID=UPI003FA6D603
MWDAIAEPVLNALDLRETTKEGHRLWWAPTGLLTFLPLHAAGHHEEGDRDGARPVLDRVVSSYTPTLRALREARRLNARVDRSRIGCVVALPDCGVPWISALPAVEHELEMLTGRFPGIEVLRGLDATPERVREAIQRHGWIHFACHGVSHRDDPSAGALLLHRGNPLTVTDIAAMDTNGVGLAVFSACDTVRGGLKLADESIHLASAFLLAGFPQVVGTLWPLVDKSPLSSPTTPTWCRQRNPYTSIWRGFRLACTELPCAYGPCSAINLLCGRHRCTSVPDVP